MKLDNSFVSTLKVIRIGTHLPNSSFDLAALSSSDFICLKQKKIKAEFKRANNEKSIVMVPLFRMYSCCHNVRLQYLCRSVSYEWKQVPISMRKWWHSHLSSSTLILLSVSCCSHFALNRNKWQIATDVVVVAVNWRNTGNNVPWMPDSQTETSLKGLPVHFGFNRFQFFILFLLITSDNKKNIAERIVLQKTCRVGGGLMR